MLRLITRLNRIGCRRHATGQWIRSSSSFQLENSDIVKNVFKHRTFNEQDGYVWHSPYEKITIPDMTTDQYVWKNVAKWSNKVAIECSVTGRKYTYAKLRDHCAALAIQLRTRFNLNQGDIVGICLNNVPEFAIAMLGAFEAGLVVTTINPNYTAEEVSRQLLSSQPKVIIGLAEQTEQLQRACKLADQADIHIFTVKTDSKHTAEPGMIDFFEIIATKGVDLKESKFNECVNPDDLCLLPYSSGTTGVPKGVMLSHNNITSNCEALDVKLPYERLILPTTNDHQEVLPAVLPFYHCYGLLVLMVSKLSLGCKIVSIPKFEQNEFLKTVGEHKSSFLCLVPPLIVLLGNKLKGPQRELEHVRQVMSAASTLGQHDAERFRELAVNAEFYQGYGLTETSPIATLSPKGIDNHATIGWTISNVEIKIAAIDDPQLKGVDTNVPGELFIRGPNVMKGYFNNEEATKATITSDGWLRSGDIATYDDKGLFYITDRIKELIKVNSLQVAPAELEAVLRDHPDVVEAVVVGIPHPVCGEVPRAFVVKRHKSTATEEDIKAFVAKQLARHKHLTGGVDFVDQIPKTNTGKILRREVKRLFC